MFDLTSACAGATVVGHVSIGWLAVCDVAAWELGVEGRAVRDQQ